MRNLFFPTTIIDGFFDNPDSMREFALKQKYEFGKSHPGKWSQPIESINPMVYNTIKAKFLDLFFPMRENILCNCDMKFQIIDENFESGWIHRDSSIATGIIYLSKTDKKNIGTSIYRKKDIEIDPCMDIQLAQTKWELMTKKEKLKDAREKINSCYDEVIKIEGIYNRAILFDGGFYHSAQDYSGTADEDSRITIVIFFNEINCFPQMFPIQRMHRKSMTII